MVTIEIIFLGLIAVAFDEKDVPGQTGGGELKPAHQPFDVYLVKVPDHDPDQKKHRHVAELLIRRSDLETDIVGKDGIPSNTGACWPEKSKTHCMNEKLEPADCKTKDAIYAVWCLTDIEVSFEQSDSNRPHFSAGYRTASEDLKERHFKDRIPGWSKSQRRDVSWVPEMSKVVGAARIIEKPEEKSTAMLLGLNGTLSAYGMPWRRGKQHIWSWLELGSGTRDKYQQSFAEALHMELGVKFPVITLSRKRDTDKATTDRETDDTKIQLVTKPKHPIRIVNRPISSVIIQPDEERRCIAWHFEFHYILADIGGQKKLVPYYTLPKGEEECPKPPMAFAGYGVVSDSFCPPTILTKPPTGP